MIPRTIHSVATTRTEAEETARRLTPSSPAIHERPVRAEGRFSLVWVVVDSPPRRRLDAGETALANLLEGLSAVGEVSATLPRAEEPRKTARALLDYLGVLYDGGG